jgi:hypothetical protein
MNNTPEGNMFLASGNAYDYLGSQITAPLVLLLGIIKLDGHTKFFDLDHIYEL